MNANPEEQYGDLRAYWGQFLDSLLFKVKDVISRARSAVRDVPARAGDEAAEEFRMDIQRV